MSKETWGQEQDKVAHDRPRGADAELHLLHAVNEHYPLYFQQLWYHVPVSCLVALGLFFVRKNPNPKPETLNPIPSSLITLAL